MNVCRNTKSLPKEVEAVKRKLTWGRTMLITALKRVKATEAAHNLLNEIGRLSGKSFAVLTLQRWFNVGKLIRTLS